uniref:Uncharacterized protein n=1 Tax=viral metagenome TaxID=1070528 RepID=A0A6C0BEB6_9ZZZZ
MIYHNLDLYFNKTASQINDEYSRLLSLGKINSTDSDIKILLIMSSLKLNPEIFSSDEISIISTITNIRINNIRVSFDVIYPILKSLLSNNSEESRIDNMNYINKSVNLGLIPSHLEIDSSPPVKNYNSVSFESPDCRNLSNSYGSENMPIYFEWK